MLTRDVMTLLNKAHVLGGTGKSICPNSYKPMKFSSSRRKINSIKHVRYLVGISSDLKTAF